MKVYIIGVGDELLIGQVTDTNSVWMAQQLGLIGGKVIGKTTVSDTGSAIRSAVMRALQEADAILLTGGLGATKDDITKRELAALFQTELVWHQPTYDLIVERFEAMRRPMPETNSMIAWQPASAKVLTNSRGLAPGMMFEQTDGKIIVSMPGVPYEMKAIMKDHVLPFMKAHFNIASIEHRTLLTAGTGETWISREIADLEDSLPEHIKLAYLPSIGTVRVRLSGQGNDAEALNIELDGWQKLIADRIGAPVVAFEDITLPAVIHRLLKGRKQTLALAESCTGGYVSHLITQLPGASAIFLGGIASYANDVKINQLGVSIEDIAAHGAVSEPVVLAMAAGVKKMMGSDWAVAISGIMGPDGATEEKPVGLVWLAVVGPDTQRTAEVRFGYDRNGNIEAASTAALNLLRLAMIN
jgi:nicotinamide-nucleotide amidase